MKEKIHYVIEAVIIVAVITLFAFHFSGNKTSPAFSEETSGGGAVSTEVMPVAYIDVDSLMSSYTYSIELNEQLMKKYENSQADLNEKAAKLEADAQSFQRKYQTGSFISEDRAKAEHDQILRSEEALQNLRLKLTQEFREEQIRTNEELAKTILTYLKEFNTDNRFHIVYGKMNDNILYANDSYNITAEFIDFLNKKYAASPILGAK